MTKQYSINFPTGVVFEKDVDGDYHVAGDVGDWSNRKYVSPEFLKKIGAVVTEHKPLPSELPIGSVISLNRPRGPLYTCLRVSDGWKTVAVAHGQGSFVVTRDAYDDGCDGFYDVEIIYVPKKGDSDE